MPYIRTEEVKEIRKDLKEAFPNIKMSIVRRHHSSVEIAIMQADFDFLPNEEKKYMQVNDMYLERYERDGELSKEAIEVIEKISKIARRDQKESQYDYDYGSIPNFYVNVSIGKWDKPFEVK